MGLGLLRRTFSKGRERWHRVNLGVSGGLRVSEGTLAVPQLQVGDILKGGELAQRQEALDKEPWAGTQRTNAA